MVPIFLDSINHLPICAPKSMTKLSNHNKKLEIKVCPEKLNDSTRLRHNLKPFVKAYLRQCKRFYSKKSLKKIN